MKKIRKLLTIIPLLLFFFAVIPCQAKEEETTEVKLIDVGHGIKIPESFDVKDENGNFVTITGVRPEDWAIKEVDEPFYTMTLDNGYRVEKAWDYIEDTDNKLGIMEITVYDTEGEMIFFMGKTADTFARTIELTCMMNDGEGNGIRNEYEQQGYGKGHVPEIRTKSFDGETLAVMNRYTYDAELDIMKEYVLSGDILNLYTKYEYGAEGGGVCTEYRVAMMDEEYDQDDEYYEVCSYKKDDIVEENFLGPYYDGSVLTYGITYTQHPSVITKEGVDYHLYKVASINDNWSTEEERELLEGKVVESVYYFTKEQIEVLEAENIIYYHEIMERHPDFIFPDWDSELMDPVNGKVVEAPVETPESTPQAVEAMPEASPQAVEATPGVEELTPEPATEVVEPTPEPTPEVMQEPTSKGAKVSKRSDGTIIYRQPITGATMPINGQIPAELETQEWYYEGYLQVNMFLNDANGKHIDACGMGYDLEHIKYDYVHFTTITLYPDYPSKDADFSIMGTNTPFEGVVFNYEENPSGLAPMNSLAGPGRSELTYNGETIIGESYHFIGNW